MSPFLKLLIRVILLIPKNVILVLILICLSTWGVNVKTAHASKGQPYLNNDASLFIAIHLFPTGCVSVKHRDDGKEQGKGMI